MSEPSTVKVMYLWSPARFAWLPLIVGVTRRGHDLIPTFRAQLDDYGFSTIVGGGFPDDDQVLINRIAEHLRPPRYAAQERLLSPPTDLPATAGASADVEASDVPVLYVWSDARGCWKPLIVAVTPLGRQAVSPIAADLQEAGVSTFLASVPLDDANIIVATARNLPPAQNAGFIDPAPDGIISDDDVGLDLIAVASPTKH